ncbi:MAG: SDR family NAD(P)-dependent oxidoreductase [Spirochaetales bacterium]|jgi:sorbitol-6-phosphate 2-dehydrogenase|nr:SDR family NAD(P)-dependent oxidoreductase [Spirochaetales bacterium]
MKFTLRLEQELPPVLRGLTFDGQKGLFVHRTEGKKVDLTLPVARVGDSIEEKIGQWKTLLAAYTEARRLYPAVIGFEGLELQFGLGTNYDEAVRAEGVSALPVLPPSTSRSDVVRDKIALVTGGAQGFGEGMVRALVEHGAFVYIADMNAEGAKKLADELNYEACITVAKSIAVNVTDELSVEQMMDEVASQTGSLDLFVSNAGVLRAGSVKSMALKDFQFVTNVDYTGFFICTKFASQQLALQNLASKTYFTDIIAISSKSGLEGSNKNGAYAGAKFGTIGLTQSFALELVEDNIKVNAICPGNFLDGPLWSDPEKGLFVQYLAAGKVPGAKTIADVRRFYEAKVPMNRGCRTEDVVKAILYIVEQTYETGQAVPVTGGQVMLN